MAQIFKPRPKAKTPLLQRTSVVIDDVDYLGQGVCRTHKPLLFVQGGLPGEQVELEVTSQKNNFWQGTAKKISQPADARIQPFCQYFGQCGGCQTQHAQPQDMRGLKRAAIDTLLTRSLDIQSLDWHEDIASSSVGYRRKCRLAIDARNKKDVRIGFRGQHSNKVIDVKECQVLVPELAALIAPINELVKGLDSPLSIGHIVLLRGQSVTQVSFRLIKPLGKNDRLNMLDFATSQNCQVQLESSQGQTERLSDDHRELDICISSELSLGVQPDDFIQVNHQVNLQMIEQAISWLALSDNDHVVDLFCGLGNFSLPVAARCHSVLAIEGVAKMVQRAEQNAQKNGIANCRFVTGDLTEADILQKLGAVKGCKVLLDPSREGAQAVIPQVAALSPSHILYVSCNPATFVRDAKLLNTYKYRLEKISLMDMFPNTTHTELMALFVPLKS